MRFVPTRFFYSPWLPVSLMLLLDVLLNVSVVVISLETAQPQKPSGMEMSPQGGLPNRFSIPYHSVAQSFGSRNSLRSSQGVRLRSLEEVHESVEPSVSESMAAEALPSGIAPPENILVSPKGIPRYLFCPIMQDDFNRVPDHCASLDTSFLFRSDVLTGGEDDSSDATAENIASQPITGRSALLSNVTSNAVTARLKRLAENSHLWPWIGLLHVTGNIRRNYDEQMKHRAKGWYIHKMLSSRSFIADPLAGAVSCTAFSMTAARLPVVQGVCNCMERLTPEQLCLAVDSYAQVVHCHDRYAELVDPSVVCPSLLVPDLGVPISTTCSRYLTMPAYIKLGLYDIRNKLQGTPETVGRETYKAELGTYYALHKALQRLTRWADLHLFCLDKGQNFPSGGHGDLELIANWDVKYYFYIQRHGQKPLPIAVLAHYTPTSDEDDKTQRKSRWLLVVRDVRTTFEGYIQMVTRSAAKHYSDYVGSVHEGYSAVATSLGTSVVESLLRKDAQQLGSEDAIHLTVATQGNFGTGVGLILLRNVIYALTPSTTNDFLLPDGPQLRYHFVSFGGGPVGDTRFMEDMKTRVNMRNIVSDQEGMEGMPCVATRGCDLPSTVLRTGRTGETVGHFAPLVGNIRIPTQSLPYPGWSKASSRFEVVANMICSSSCWLGSSACQDAAPQCSYAGCGAFISPELLWLENQI